MVAKQNKLFSPLKTSHSLMRQVSFILVTERKGKSRISKKQVPLMTVPSQLGPAILSVSRDLLPLPAYLSSGWCRVHCHIRVRLP